MPEPRPRVRLSLVWKFLLAFALVVLAGIGAVSLVANQVAAREVRSFMFRGGMTTASALADSLIGYYRGRGSWQGVESLLGAPRMGMGPGGAGMMGVRLRLADDSGHVIAGDRAAIGSSLTAAEMQAAENLQVDGSTIGYLLVDAGGQSGEAGVLARLRQGMLLAGIASGLAALLLGGILVVSLLKPVRELTAASRDLASGNLTRRVTVASGDEIGELSSAFNQMADAIERAERLRREMTADIAHELRNPLAVMQARLEAVIDGVHPLSVENLEPVLEQSRLLNRLVEDLRTLALADAGNLAIEKTPMDLMQVASGMVESYQAQALAEEIRLRLQAQTGTAVMINADPARMRQVIGNLLANALRHTPHGGLVALRVSEAQAGWASLIVEDSGQGFPAEVMPYLFERFAGGERRRDPRDGGTGLGLAIVRQLVLAHGGTVEAENRWEGGARVTVGIPLWPADPPKTAA
jgi:two-component system sensor histidine kinase BaeS